MKTIRSKLVSIYMISTAVVLGVILLLFNVGMRFYFVKNARDELRSTYAAMNILVERQLNSVGQGDTTVLSELNAALTASRLSGSTKFYILNENFRVLFPADAKLTILEGALGRAVRNYNFSGNPGGIVRTLTKNGPLFIAGKSFDRPVSGTFYVVFVTGMSGGNRVTGAIDLILIAIMAVTLVIEYLYAAKSARDLSRPIQQMCGYVKEIGNGKFITVPEDQSLLETKELTAGISEMSARLKAADEAQKLFLQNASHELRTPLMSIQGYSEAIEKGIAKDPVQAAAVIKTESIRLTALVEELITLSKIDNKIYDKTFIKIDVGEALSECVYRLNGLALKEQKEIVLKAIPGVTVTADENLLAKAIHNVLSNCIRYAKKTVSVELSYQDNMASIRISDDGEGIAPADLPHIFDRFYKGKGGKFGLGLAIAKKALEIMGGSITAQNGSSGAVFEMRLPAELEIS